MKKLLLSAVTLTFCVFSFAQNRPGLPISAVNRAANDKPVPMMYPVSGDEILPLKAPSFLNHTSRIAATQQPIGTTTYDLQSNGSSVATRVYNVGSEIGIAWTFSSDGTTTFADRGTAVNNSADNGASWNPQPIGRIESKRTGFGSLDRLGSGEVVISHAAGSPLTLWSRPNLVSPWDSSMIPFNSAGYPLWNAMKVGGNNGTTIHMVTATAPVAQAPAGALFNGMDGAMIYYRSLDGGINWDTPGIQLPESDTSAASPYLGFRANGYSIDVKGDVIAIVGGSVATDWSLWKSTDNGSTWTRTAIMPFPKPKFDQVTMDTDVDGDGVGDTLLCVDGAMSVVLDNNGVAHCFAGAMLVLEEPGAGALGLFLSTNGLLYWNENMGANAPLVIAQSEDINADGDLTFAADLGGRYGNDGICSMPTCGVDAYNNIYVAYSSLMENTTNGGSPEWSFRNVLAKASQDGGITWLPEFNISNSLFDEAVHPSMAALVDAPGCLHLQWQQDGAPGNSLATTNPTPVSLNDIIYSCVDPIADLNIVLGINENSVVSSQISISPNPAKDFTDIHYNLNKAASVEVEVFNITGQRVAQYNENFNTSGSHSLRIDTSKLSKGLYSINSKIDGTVYTNKLVIK